MSCLCCLKGRLYTGLNHFGQLLRHLPAWHDKNGKGEKNFFRKKKKKNFFRKGVFIFTLFYF